MSSLSTRQDPAIYSCLNAVSILMDLNMVDTKDVLELCGRFSPLVLHPSAWIREGAIKVRRVWVRVPSLCSRSRAGVVQCIPPCCLEMPVPYSSSVHAF